MAASLCASSLHPSTVCYDCRCHGQRVPQVLRLSGPCCARCDVGPCNMNSRQSGKGPQRREIGGRHFACMHAAAAARLGGGHDRRLPAPHRSLANIQIIMLAVPGVPGSALGFLAPAVWRLGRALSTAAASSAHGLADSDRIFTNLYGRRAAAGGRKVLRSKPCRAVRLVSWRAPGEPDQPLSGRPWAAVLRTEWSGAEAHDSGGGRCRCRQLPARHTSLHPDFGPKSAPLLQA